MGEYMKYLDESLSFEERAEDLVSRMTLEECASQLLYTAKAVDRLGVKEYNWWNEALHGVARSGTATVFPQAIGMASSFDTDLIQKVGDVISTEGRAKYNEYQKAEDYEIYKGLTFWSPNVNLFRDPRWGRGQETYGEDPYLTAELGKAFVHGVQGSDPRYLKAAACAKHFAVHSGPEKLRHEFDAVASPQDMEETYLPQFRALVEAGVEGFMGAYNRTNGEPCCGSKTLLLKTLREKWGFKGYVTSDCWAVNDFHLHHKITDNPEQSVKLALENGCQLNCGCAFEYVMMAYEHGLITEKTIRDAATQLMTTRMRLGMFDQATPWDELNIGDIDTEEFAKINEQMARESMVLLKNDGILPVDPKKIKNILVAGPNANSITALNGNYHGTASRYVTVLDGIRAAFPEARVFYSESFLQQLALDKPLGLSEAHAMAAYADLTVLVTGLDETIEGEEDMGGPRMQGDKEDLLLPEIQRQLIDTIASAGKPFVLVNMTGSAMDFAEGGEKANAVIQAWYPGALGGKAVADLLTGAYSPSGRLPLTFYKNDNDIPEFTDYSMKNRTYKYFEGEPLYPFGYGLSYTKFAYQITNAASEVKASELAAGAETPVTVLVKNVGNVDSETVVECYLKDVESSVTAPKYRLAGFRRVFVKAGEQQEVTVKIPAQMFTIVTETGEREFEPGEFILYAGGAQPDALSRKLTQEETDQASILLI